MRKNNQILRILNHLGQPIPYDFNDRLEIIRKYIYDEKRISAIKEYKAVSGLGLKESKAFTDRLSEMDPRTLWKEVQDFRGKHIDFLGKEEEKKHTFKEDLL